MKAILAAAAVLMTGIAGAQPIHLYGTVGKAPVFVDLNRNGDTVSGWYFYLKVGKEIRLEGKLNPKGFFQMEEYTANTNTRTGTFTGRAVGGHWAGSWKNAAGRKTQDLGLDELRSKLADVNGRFACTARRRDAEFGYTYTHKLDLTLAKGRVAKFAMSNRERGEDGTEQSCRIAIGALKQLPAPVGILLRGKADRTGGAQHCTIRLYRAGDYLVLRTGDTSQAGDDCRGAGDEMFCSPNSFWSDLVVNRNTRQCRPVK
jgi:hypothetical protein